jgi:hypothetical protein
VADRFSQEPDRQEARRIMDPRTVKREMAARVKAEMAARPNREPGARTRWEMARTAMEAARIKAVLIARTRMEIRGAARLGIAEMEVGIPEAVQLRVPIVELETRVPAAELLAAQVAELEAAPVPAVRADRLLTSLRRLWCPDRELIAV